VCVRVYTLANFRRHRRGGVVAIRARALLHIYCTQRLIDSDGGSRAYARIRRRRRRRHRRSTIFTYRRR